MFDYFCFAFFFSHSFQVWGYFSVHAHGGVHAYADSQFGHLFARGKTREHARTNMVQALKELSIRVRNLFGC